MEFEPEKLGEFHEIFDATKHLIRAFPGCLHLELHQDARHPEVRYTFSMWESEEALNAYRASELFGSVWPKTKTLFKGKPLAYSLIKLQEV